MHTRHYQLWHMRLRMLLHEIHRAPHEHALLELRHVPNVWSGGASCRGWIRGQQWTEVAELRYVPSTQREKDATPPDTEQQGFPAAPCGGARGGKLHVRAVREIVPEGAQPPRTRKVPHGG